MGPIGFKVHVPRPNDAQQIKFYNMLFLDLKMYSIYGYCCECEGMGV